MNVKNVKYATELDVKTHGLLSCVNCVKIFIHHKKCLELGMNELDLTIKELIHSGWFWHNLNKVAKNNYKRFWSRWQTSQFNYEVDTDTGCWIFKKANPVKFLGDVHGGGFQVSVHDYQYDWHYDDRGFHKVYHSCGTPDCINPKHYVIGDVHEVLRGRV
jgi:hypothetical protein